MNRRLLVTVAAAALLASSAAASFAQSPTAVKAAHDATRAAKAVTYRLMTGTAQSGTVTLQQIGRTRSRVTVRFNAAPANGTRLGLYRGSDCIRASGATALAPIALSPLDATQTSRTIVAVPISALRSGNYLVAVRNATQQQQAAQTCARLGNR
jgi:opacity protein-like surface antigen